MNCCGQWRFLFVFYSFLDILTLHLHGDVHHLTRDEASHIGLPYHESPIIHEFYQFLEDYSSQSLRQINDFTQHHRIIKLFCSLKDPPSCLWSEYYQILDSLRLPFLNTFDPGMKSGIRITNIQDKYHSGSLHQKKCSIISYPSSDEFLEYVLGSKPVIIRGLLPSSTNSSSWSLSNLVTTLGHYQVVVSAAPTGEFDGPENPTLWGIPDDPNQYELIARPAHINLKFSEFVSLLKNPKQNISSQFYLEYFPLYALFHSTSPSSTSSEHVSSSTNNYQQELLRHLPQHTFAEWLSMKYHLLWLGGGEQARANKRSPSANKRQKKILKTLKDQDQSHHVPISRMHFDRMENLMTMIRGRKRFYLYDPGQSSFLYGGIPMIQASLKASLRRDPINGNGDLTIEYTRDTSTIQMNPNIYHTYSPVNVRSPNYTKHPKFKEAKGIICDLKEGDTLYIPSHWWHEVLTYPDDEGKSIGINSFFEPFYHRYGHNTSSDLFQKNRYYEPIDEIGSTYLCGKVENKKNCYIQATEFSPENTLETNNEKNQKKHKGRKQLKQLPKRSPSKRRKGVYSEKEL